MHNLKYYVNAMPPTIAANVKGTTTGYHNKILTLLISSLTNIKILWQAKSWRH